MVPLFLYTVDGVMIDCLVMSWPWSLSSIMRLFTSLVSWGLVYFQRRAYMHVCSLKIGQLLQPDSLFSVCCQMHDSRVSLWQTLLPKISQRMMGKLLYNHTQVTPSAVACFTACFWWARFKACWALFKNWRNSDCVLLPYHGFRGCFHFNCKTGECLSLVLGCDHICSLVSLPPWICILISCQKRNAEISSGVLGALCTF